MAYEKIFSALADPTRRHIFECLRDGPKTVGELSKTQSVSRPAVSQHLKILQNADLVDVRPQGTRRFNYVKRDGLEALRQYLDTYWSDVLTAYSSEIERSLGEDDAGTDKKSR